MDRVREAMELALEEHWGRGSEPGSEAPAKRIRTPDRTTPPARGPAPVEPPLSAAPPTPRVPRQLPIDPAVLVKNRLVAAVSESAEREAFCLLQAMVADRMAGPGPRLLGVTSPRRARGKTFTAVNLAIGLASQRDRVVVLIDLDLRQPTVHARFGLEPSAGIESCLFEQAALSEVMFAPDIEGAAGRLMVLPSRGGSHQVAKILESVALEELLAELGKLYPDCLVVIDLPAITSAADAKAFARIAGRALLVVEAGTTRQSEYRRALKALGKSIVLGTVLNAAASNNQSDA